MSLFQIVAPEYHDFMRDRLSRRAAGEELPQPFRFEVVRRDGTRAWIELVTTPVMEGSSLVAVQGIARDITERIRAERELRAIRDRLEHLVSESPAVIYSETVGDPVRVTYISPNAPRILGASVEQFADNEYRRSLLHPEEAARVHQALVHPIRLGVGQLEHRFRVADGSWRWVLNHFNVLPGPTGEPAELIGHMLDITDRKDAELAFQAAQQRLEHLISASPAVIYSQAMTDPPHLTYVSPNVQGVFGYAPHEVTGRRSWLQRVHPDDAGVILASLSRLAETGHGRIEYRYHHADGSWRWVLDEFNVFRATADGVPEVVGHVVDITPRKEAEEALRAAHVQLVNAREDERRRLAGDLHDSLGQELISLHLRMQSLVPDLLPHVNEQLAAELELVLQRCQAIIREVRTISHGLYPPLLESVGLAAALREMAARITTPIPIRVDCPPAMEKLRWPPEVEIALFRIAQEALGNAVRHSHAKLVELRLQYKRRCAILSIHDDGLGFDPHRKAPGLGLSTMRDRAETVGGELRVESVPGSTHVEVRVPAEATRRE
jgi:PAS domain S-box-containing protein